MVTGEIEVRGDAQVILLVDAASGDTVGSAYALDDEPGWWRGIGPNGKLRRLWVAPGVAKPGLDVGRRLVAG
ncbi:hypothetical protein E1281_01120 [Actinomadura sp. KC345]|uniref:hypothetical protein n=1 Tax=Actinomadura sp. KC345 TaxID=2530371 RepID=UPI001046FC33|nr:hypothetical protein [Actinomadura sp. KC345]TDC58581.1 hypothetical protein E1281_01120 [Actinomadura sp. KC345]